METKDLIVIGGGINGAGIAADAAGRGLSVLMLEAQDLACATSSASSKLIHGGLRYLEHYEFRLVSEALAEREVLLKMAPHIAFPMRFRLPHRAASVWLKWKDGATSPPPAPPAVRRGWWCVPAPCA